MRWVVLYQAIVYACSSLLLSGLIPEWGRWYSERPQHREQVDAFLRGSLAVSQSPSALGLGLAWSEAGVHQVWGLGVPLWHLPFVACSRLFGAADFPDMLSFGIALALTAWAAFGTFCQTQMGDFQKRGAQPRLPGLLAGLGAGLFSLLFPPFLGLMSSRFNIFEEVIAYEYLFGVVLFSGLVWLVQRPSANRYWLLCGLAGFGGLIRPTLVFYGFATVVAGAWALWLARRSASGAGFQPAGHAGLSLMAELEERPGASQDANPTLTDSGLQARSAWHTLLVGGLLFAIGGGVLFATNLARFGNGFEFGHKLNILDVSGSMYATRFDDPYQHEPVISAAEELFGLMFLAKNPKVSACYQTNIFPLQSKTVRWREIYLRTYDLSYLALLLGGLGAGALSCLQLVRAAPLGRTPDPLGNSNLANRIQATLMLWAVLATVPLLGFYLRVPVIASRYLLDFMPAFAAVLVVGWLGLCRNLEGRRSAKFLVPIAFVLLAVWSGWETSNTPGIYGRPQPFNHAEVHDQRKSKALAKTLPTLPGIYETGTNFSTFGIPFNGAGWSTSTGAVMPCIVLFVGDPEFLELELTSELANVIESDLRHLRAKIGLEFLEPDLVRKTDRGWTVRFHGPKKKRYQKGIQPAFVVFVPNTELAAQTTPWQLLKVRWRENRSEKPLARRGGAGFQPIMGSVLPLLSEIGAGTPAAGALEARSTVRSQVVHSTPPP